MAEIKGTNVIAPVVPLDTTDVHPSHEARYGKGGYRTVATTAERDAIPAPRRESGMLVFVQADSTVYQLGTNLTTWTTFSSGDHVPDPHAASHGSAGSDPVTVAVSQVTGLQTALDGKAAASHTHTIANVTGLQTALDGKQASGSYAAASHTHGISDVTGLQTALDGKAASSHTHAISSVTGLQAALDAKATPSDVTTAVAAVVNAAPASLDTLKELADALGNDASFATTVTNSLAGKAPIASPTFTGTVGGITKSMVGLGNVDNTSDANKPISTATQTALDGKAATVHTHNQTAIVASETLTYVAFSWTGGQDITNLLASLDTSIRSKANASHGHAPADVTFAASDRLLGRSSSGAGSGEEIVCTSAGRALLDDADAAAQRTTLSAQKTITSGTAAPTGGSDGDIYLQYTA